MGHVQVHRLCVTSESSPECMPSLVTLPQILWPSCLGDVPKGMTMMTSAAHAKAQTGHNKVSCDVFSLLGPLRREAARRRDQPLARQRHLCLVGLAGAAFGDTVE